MTDDAAKLRVTLDKWLRGPIQKISWKPSARRDLEAAGADWIERDRARAIAAFIVSPASDDDIALTIRLCDQTFIRAFEALPPRRGRGGLSRQARIVSRFVKERRSFFGVTSPFRPKPGRPRKYESQYLESFVSTVTKRRTSGARSDAAAIREILYEAFRAEGYSEIDSRRRARESLPRYKQLHSRLRKS